MTKKDLMLLLNEGVVKDAKELNANERLLLKPVYRLMGNNCELSRWHKEAIMSAYVCSYETISVLAKAMVDYQIDFKAEAYSQPIQIIINRQALYQSIGQALLHANVASVNYRYSESEDTPEFTYLDIIDSKYDEGMILGCIKEYSYQTSELQNWYINPIKHALDQLKDAILERLIEDKNLEIPYGWY